MLLLDAIFLVLVAFLLAYLIRHYLFTITALYHHDTQVSRELQGMSYQPKVTVLIPAYNEEKVIERTLRRMTELTYPKEKLEVITIDDGSGDRTREISEKFSKEYDFIKVIHRDPKKGGKGKAHALNEGLKHVNGEIVYCFDADYYPQQDILEKLTASFVHPEIGGVQGRVVVLNEADTIVTRLVTLERIGGYRVDQVAREKLRLIPQFGGTVGGFRKRILDQLGGWDTDILAEDTDLTFRIYLAGYRIRYVNEAECYEEAVRDWRSYWHQRYRWALGHMQCAFKHLWPLLKSRKLQWREKLDGFFLLNVYFVPLLVGLAWIIGLVSYFTQP